MKYRVEITASAEADIDEAYRYIFEVRQKLYGRYRILFTIEADRVIVLNVRHVTRLPLKPDEIDHA